VTSQYNTKKQTRSLGYSFACTTVFFFFERILESGPIETLPNFIKRKHPTKGKGPIWYCVLELVTQVATLICLDFFLTGYTEKKIQITYGYFRPWMGGVFGYFRLHCVFEN
jgi:hypothetical protein